MPPKSRPFVMAGRPHPTTRRTTSVDRPDPRIEPVEIPQLTSEQLRVLERPGAIDPRLRSTDRCFQRWGATPGSGALLPHLARVCLVASSRAHRAPALNDREAELVDEAVRSADPPEQRFVIAYYRMGNSMTEIAQLLGMRRRQSVYEERRLVLSYFRGRLQGLGLRLPAWAVEP